MVQQAPGIRLTELMAALSLVSDLGMGQPMEHNLRQCLLAARLGDRIGLDDTEREGVFYAGIMAWVGCHVDAYEQTKWFGDEMALKGDSRTVDFATARAGMAFTFGHVAAGRPLLHRARAGIGFIGGGMRDAEAMLDNHWRAVDSLAARVGLDDDRLRPLGQLPARGRRPRRRGGAVRTLRAQGVAAGAQPGFRS